jgi:hypothetical protein
MGMKLLQTCALFSSALPSCYKNGARSSVAETHEKRERERERERRRVSLRQGSGAWGRRGARVGGRPSGCQGQIGGYSWSQGQGHGPPELEPRAPGNVRIGIGGTGCQSWSWSRAMEGLVCGEWMFHWSFIYWINAHFHVEDSKRRMCHEKMNLPLEIAL